MHKRITVAALATLFASSSLLVAFAKPALADADDHPHKAHHHHAYHNGNPNWSNGRYNGQYNAGQGGWVNGKYYGPGQYTGYGNGANRPDRDDRKHHHHHKKTDNDR